MVHDFKLFACFYLIGNIECERRVSAVVLSDIFAVYKEYRAVVTRFEVKKHSARPGFGNFNRSSVPARVEKVRIADARKFALRTERNVYFFGESNFVFCFFIFGAAEKFPLVVVNAAVAVIVFEIPFAV